MRFVDAPVSHRSDTPAWRRERGAAQNAGRHVYLPGFRLGPRMLKYLPGALARLARLELLAIPDRLRVDGSGARSRRCRRSERLDVDERLPRADFLTVRGDDRRRPRPRREARHRRKRSG